MAILPFRDVSKEVLVEMEDVSFSEERVSFA
jgi:hypothetical protein